MAFNDSIFRVKQQEALQKKAEKTRDAIGGVDFDSNYYEAAKYIQPLYQESQNQIDISTAINNLQRHQLNTKRNPHELTDIEKLKLLNKTISARKMDDWLDVANTLDKTRRNAEEFELDRQKALLQAELTASKLREAQYSLDMDKEQKTQALQDQLNSLQLKQSMNVQADTITNLTGDTRTIDRSTSGAIENMWRDAAITVADMLGKDNGGQLIHDLLSSQGDLTKDKREQNSQPLGILDRRLYENEQDQGLLSSLSTKTRNIADIAGTEIAKGLIGGLSEQVAPLVGGLASTLTTGSPIPGFILGNIAQAGVKARSLNREAIEKRSGKDLDKFSGLSLKDDLEYAPEAALYTAANSADLLIAGKGLSTIKKALAPLGKGTERIGLDTAERHIRASAKQRSKEALKDIAKYSTLEGGTEAFQTALEENAKDGYTLRGITRGEHDVSEYIANLKKHKRAIKESAIAGAIASTGITSVSGTSNIAGGLVKDSVAHKKGLESKKNLLSKINDENYKNSAEYYKDLNNLSNAYRTVGIEDKTINKTVNKDLAKLRDIQEENFKDIIKDGKISEEDKELLTTLYKANINGVVRAIQSSKDIKTLEEYKDTATALAKATKTEQKLELLDKYGISNNIFEKIVYADYTVKHGQELFNTTIEELKTELKKLKTEANKAENGSAEKIGLDNLLHSVTTRLKELIQKPTTDKVNQAREIYNLTEALQIDTLDPLEKTKLIDNVNKDLDIQTLSKINPVSTTKEVSNALKDNSFFRVGEGINTAGISEEDANLILKDIERQDKPINIYEQMRNNQIDSKTIENTLKAHISKIKAKVQRDKSNPKSNMTETKAAIKDSGLINIFNSLLDDSISEETKERYAEIISKAVLDTGLGQTFFNLIDETLDGSVIKRDKDQRGSTPSVENNLKPNLTDKIDATMKYLKDFIEKQNKNKSFLLSMSSAIRRLRRNSHTNYAAVVADQLDKLTEYLDNLYLFVGNKEKFSKATYNKAVLELSNRIRKLEEDIVKKKKAQDNAIAYIKANQKEVKALANDTGVVYYKWNRDNPNKIEFLENDKAPKGEEEVSEINKNDKINYYINYVALTEVDSSIVAEGISKNDAFSKLLDDELKLMQELKQNLYELTDEAAKSQIEASTIEVDKTIYASTEAFINDITKAKQEARLAEIEAIKLKRLAIRQNLTPEQNQRLVNALNKAQALKKRYDSLRLALDSKNSGLTPQQVKEVKTLLDINNQVSQIEKNLTKVKTILGNLSEIDNPVTALIDLATAIMSSIKTLMFTINSLPKELRDKYALDTKLRNLILTHNELDKIGVENILKQPVKIIKFTSEITQALQPIRKALRRLDLDKVKTNYLDDNPKFKSVMLDYLKQGQPSSAFLTDVVINFQKNKESFDMDSFIKTNNLEAIKADFDKAVSENKANLDINTKDLVFLDLFENKEYKKANGVVGNEGELKDFYKDILFISYIYSKGKFQTPSNISKEDALGNKTTVEVSTSFENLLADSFLKAMYAKWDKSLTEGEREAKKQALGKMFNSMYNLEDLHTSNIDKEIIKKAQKALSNKNDMFKSDYAFTDDLFEALDNVKDSNFNGVLTQSADDLTTLALERFSRQEFKTKGIKSVDNIVSMLTDEKQQNVLVNMLYSIFGNFKVEGSKSELPIQILNTKMLNERLNELSSLGEAQAKLAKSIRDKFNLGEVEPVNIENLTHMVNHHEAISLSDRLAEAIKQYTDIYIVGTSIDKLHPKVALQELNRMSVEGTIGNIQNNKILRAVLGYFKPSGFTNNLADTMNERINANQDLVELTLMTVIEDVSPGRLSEEDIKKYQQDKKTQEKIKLFKELLADDSKTSVEKAYEFSNKLGLLKDNKINFGSVLSLFDYTAIKNNQLSIDTRYLVIEIDGNAFGYSSISGLFSMTEEQLLNASRGNINNYNKSAIYADNYEQAGLNFIEDAFDILNTASNGEVEYKLDLIPVGEVITNVDMYEYFKELNLTKHRDNPVLQKILSLMLDSIFKPTETKELPNATGKSYRTILRENFKDKARKIGKGPVTLAVYGSGIKANAGKMALNQMSDAVRGILTDVIAEDTLVNSIYEVDNGTLFNQLLANVNNVNKFEEVFNEEVDIKLNTLLMKHLETKYGKDKALDFKQSTLESLYDQFFILSQVLGINSKTDFVTFFDESSDTETALEKAANNLSLVFSPILEETLERQSGYQKGYLDVLRKAHSIKNLYLAKLLVKDILDHKLHTKDVKDISHYIHIDKSRTDAFMFNIEDFSSKEIDEAYARVMKKIAEDSSIAEMYGFNDTNGKNLTASMFTHMYLQIKQDTETNGKREKLWSQRTVANKDDTNKDFIQQSSDKLKFVEYGTTFAPSIGQRIDSMMMQMLYTNIDPRLQVNQVFDAAIGPVAYMNEVAKILNRNLALIQHDLNRNPQYLMLRGITKNLSKMVNEVNDITEMLYGKDELSNIIDSLESITMTMEGVKELSLGLDGTGTVGAFLTGLGDTNYEKYTYPSSGKTTGDVSKFKDVFLPNINKVNKLASIVGISTAQLHTAKGFNQFIERLNTLYSAIAGEGLDDVFRKNLQNALNIPSNSKKQFIYNETENSNKTSFIDKIITFLDNNGNVNKLDSIILALDKSKTQINRELDTLSKESPLRSISTYSFVRDMVRSYLDKAGLSEKQYKNSNIEKLLTNFYVSLLNNEDIVLDDTLNTPLSITKTLQAYLNTDGTVNRNKSKSSTIGFGEQKSMSSDVFTKANNGVSYLETIGSIFDDTNELSKYKDLLRALLSHKVAKKLPSGEESKATKGFILDSLTDEQFIRLLQLLNEQVFSENPENTGEIIDNLLKNSFDIKDLVVSKLNELGYDKNRLDNIYSISDILETLSSDLEQHTPFTLDNSNVSVGTTVENPFIKLNKIDERQFIKGVAIDVKGSQRVNLDEDISLPIKQLENASKEELEAIVDDIIKYSSDSANYRFIDHSWVKERLTNTLNILSKPINLSINRGTNADTQGTYAKNGNKVTLHLTNKTTNKMSPIEIYLHEVTHAVMDFARTSSDPMIRRNYEEIQRIQKQFLVLAKQDKENLARELEVTVEQLDTYYLDYMKDTEEFVAIVNSNPAIYHYIQGMNVKLSLGEKLKKLFYGLMNLIFDSNMYIKNTNEAVNFDNLIQNIGKANQRLENNYQRNKIEKLVFGTLERGNTLVNSALSPIKSKYTEAVLNQLDKANTSNSKAFKALIATLAYPISLKTNSEVSKKIGKLLRDIAGDASGLEHFVSTMSGSDDGKEIFNYYLGRSTNIDKVRNQFEGSVKGELQAVFKGNTPSLKQQQSMTRVLKSTDISALGLDADLIIKEYLHGNKSDYQGSINILQNQLASQVTDKLSLDFMLNNIENLAQYMVTGSVKGYLLSNATNIALKLTPSQETINVDSYPYDIATVSEIIDKLVTLRALQLTPREDFLEVQSIISQYPEAMRFVINKTIDTTNASKQLFKEIVNSKGKVTYGVSNYQKGYINRPQDKTIDIRIGKISDLDKMKQLGYHLIDKYGSVGRDNVYSDLAIYYSPTEYPERYNRGVIRLTGQNTRGWTISNFIKQTNPDLDPDVLEAMTHSQMKTIAVALKESTSGGWKNAKLLPVFDTKGRIKDFNISIDKATREKLGIEEVGLFDALANETSKGLDVQMTLEHNKDFIRANEAYYRENKDNKDIKFITISPLGTDNLHNYKGIKELEDFWSMLHPEIQNYILDKHNGELHLRSDVLLTLTGYRDTRLIKDFSEGTIIKNNYVRRIGRLMEGAAFKLAALNKARIVLKNPDVVFGNLKSNMYMAALNGITPRQLLQQLPRHIEMMSKYKSDMEKISVLEGKKILKPEHLDKLQAKIDEINKVWENHPLRLLDNKGLMTDIVEDTLFEDDTNKADFYDKNVNKIISKLPSAMQMAINNLMITEKTDLWKALNTIVGMSDSLFRSIMLEAKLEEGMDSKEALNLVERTFINYGYHDGKLLKYFNDVGFMMFTKYMFRIHNTIVRDMFGDKPVTTAATLAFGATAGKMLETPLMSFLPNKFERIGGMFYIPIWTAIEAYLYRDTIHLDNFIPFVPSV